MRSGSTFGYFYFRSALVTSASLNLKVPNNFAIEAFFLIYIASSKHERGWKSSRTSLMFAFILEDPPKSHKSLASLSYIKSVTQPL